MKHLFFAAIVLFSSVDVSASTVSEHFRGYGLNAVAALYDHLGLAATFMSDCIFLGGKLRGPTNALAQSVIEAVIVDGKLTGESITHYYFFGTWHCDLP